MTVWYDMTVKVYPVRCLRYCFEVDTSSSTILSFYDYLFPNNNLLIPEKGSVDFDTASLTFDVVPTVIYNTHQSFSNSPYLGFFLIADGNRMIGIEKADVVEYYTNVIKIILLDNPPLLNLKRPYLGIRVIQGSPQNPYATQKQIQNTVRVTSSLYADNVSALNVFEGPKVWRSTSDRINAHVQKTSTSNTCSTRGTITRCRPNALCPGGVGVDVKHGSYARYMGRLKGGKPYRAEPVPPNYGLRIPFNPAAPVYGNKTLKTSIVKCL